MNEIDSMCEFRGSKQKAFNEACCAFANSENMTKLAKAVDMNATMLRNKLNPEQPHVLSCVEAIILAKVSGNHTIVNSLLLGLDVVTAYIPPKTMDDAFVLCALESSTHSGELSRMALEYAGNQRLTRAQKHKIIHSAHASIGVQVKLLRSLEKLNQGVCLLKVMDEGVGANGLSASNINSEK
ncbi:phage regulatory CII family protein [Vibrio lentus]